MSYNAIGAGNQQGSFRNPSETTRRTPKMERNVVQAYLFGAMHDGTIRGNRYRIAQKGTAWLQVMQKILQQLEYKSWIYQEGKQRKVYILESVAPIFSESFDPTQLTDLEEIRAYLRGFFDAEGGIPHSRKAKRYVQLVQKDYQKIQLIKKMLERLGVATGKIHNPSKKVDPHYWRVYVSMPSIPRFAKQIGSWHPKKHAIFHRWMMI